MIVGVTTSDQQEQIVGQAPVFGLAAPGSAACTGARQGCGTIASQVSSLTTAAGVATRQTWTAEKGAVLTPWTKTRPDLRLPGTASSVTLYFSPSWNPSSLAGGAMIYGTVRNTTLLYLQMVNSSGPYLDACPVVTAQEVLWPTCPMGTTPASPGDSPTVVDGVMELGWRPPLPKADLVLQRDLVVSDSVLITSPGMPVNAGERASLFLRLYTALLPLLLPSTHTRVDDWQQLALRSADDIANRNGTGVLSSGGRLLRVYYNDFRLTNIELIAQLDVITSIRHWSNSSTLAQELATAVRRIDFYHPELRSISDMTASHVITPGDGMLFDGFFLLNHMVKLGEMAVDDDDTWARGMFLQSIDHIIEMGREFGYVFGIYKPLPLQKATLPGFKGFIEERSDVYGYLYVMMLAHSLTGNSTYLAEARAVHAAPGALHRQEFFSMYDRAGFLEWGSRKPININTTCRRSTSQAVVSCGLWSFLSDLTPQTAALLCSGAADAGQRNRRHSAGSRGSTANSVHLRSSRSLAGRSRLPRGAAYVHAVQLHSWLLLRGVRDTQHALGIAPRAAGQCISTGTAAATGTRHRGHSHDRHPVGCENVFFGPFQTKH